MSKRSNGKSDNVMQATNPDRSAENGRSASRAAAETGRSSSGGFARAIRLLEEITSNGPLRFAELEERLKLPKASLHRALNDLLCERLIRFDERSLNYSPGFRVLELANQVWARSDIRSLARDQLETLCDRSNETVQLSVLADLHIVYIDSVESSNNVRMSMNVGNKVPVYCSAPGKALLAWCSAEEQKSILARLQFSEFTISTITQPPILLQQLEQIRHQNFAVENEEQFAGIRAVASPIVDSSGRAVAAISITAPTFRIDDEAFDYWRRLVVAAAAEVSSRLAPVTRL